MTLTIGTGPFGPQPAGECNFRKEGPEHDLYFEDSPRWVRVELDGETIASSTRMKLLHETGLLPVYYFPIEDVRTEFLEDGDRTTHCPFKGDARYWNVRVGDEVNENGAWNYPEPKDGAPDLSGYVAFYWNAMDHWYEEDEEVFVHARDPYHRIDAIPSSRHVKVEVDGELLAETDRPVVLFETGLPPRYYIPEADVRSELLEPSDTQSECPYKGTASYSSVKSGGEDGADLVWYYPQPRPEVGKIAGHMAFFNERTDLTVDGEVQGRPETPWS